MNDAQPCAWFAACENEATTTRPVPFPPYDVPICDRCARLVDSNLRSHQ